MKTLVSLYKQNWSYITAILFLICTSAIVLNSISPFVFPIYFLYIAAGLALFVFFASTDMEIFYTFSLHLYILSIVFLLTPLIIGQATRGVVRWVPLGALSVQPAEIVKPFILLFFAKYLTAKQLTFKRFMISTLLFSLPLFLILVQPSLGVATIIFTGYVGITLSLKYNKKLIVFAAIAMFAFLPIFWNFMQPYQKVRVETLFNPDVDPMGVGYNSIQSKISVGSGRLIGRGIGQGVQTQLKFLPEKHTDFIFAAISEELGLVGSSLVIGILFFLLFSILNILGSVRSFTSRAFVSGALLMLFAQVTVHIGMNMGMFPITGLPLPLLSAGGSSLLSTFILLGLIISAKTHK
jgi:rod shape determining protein RodA